MVYRQEKFTLSWCIVTKIFLYIFTSQIMADESPRSLKSPGDIPREERQQLMVSARYTIWFWRIELWRYIRDSRSFRFSKERIPYLLNKYLTMSKLFEGWVPYVLEVDQKQPKEWFFNQCWKHFEIIQPILYANFLLWIKSGYITSTLKQKEWVEMIGTSQRKLYFRDATGFIRLIGIEVKQ